MEQGLKAQGENSRSPPPTPGFMLALGISVCLLTPSRSEHGCSTCFSDSPVLSTRACLWSPRQLRECLPCCCPCGRCCPGLAGRLPQGGRLSWVFPASHIPISPGRHSPWCSPRSRFVECEPHTAESAAACSVASVMPPQTHLSRTTLPRSPEGMMPTLLCWMRPGPWSPPVLRAGPGKWPRWVLECRLGVRGPGCEGALLPGITIQLVDRRSWVRDTAWGSKTRAVSWQGLGKEGAGATWMWSGLLEDEWGCGAAVSSSVCRKA